MKTALLEVFRELNPVVVISFDPEGITDDWDHIMTSFVTDYVFDRMASGRLLLHMAVSNKARMAFPIRAPVQDTAIYLRVDVSAFTQARIGANDAHRTQFPSPFRDRWKRFVQEVPTVKGV